MAHDQLKARLAGHFLRELGAKAVRIMDGDLEVILDSGERIRVRLERV